MAKFGVYKGFGTWRLEVDGDMYYFTSMLDMKNWFKRMVKNMYLDLLKRAIKVLINYIPTESGQLAESIYNASQYAIVDWNQQLICKVKVVDPKFYTFVTTAGKTKSKTIRNPAHSHSEHIAYRDPATQMINPNVHLVGTKGKGFIYDRNDPIASNNYLAIMRQFIRDMIFTAVSRVMRKSYFVHYYIKVSKRQYGKDMYLNPQRKIPLRSVGFKALAKISAANPQPIDEFGTFLTLYNKP